MATTSITISNANGNTTVKIQFTLPTTKATAYLDAAAREWFDNDRVIHEDKTGVPILFDDLTNAKQLNVIAEHIWTEIKRAAYSYKNRKYNETASIVSAQTVEAELGE